MNGKKRFRAALFATFAGAMVTASPAVAERSFQFKNCISSSNSWSWPVFNADDDVDVVAYMFIKFSAFDQTKTGKCDGDGEGYCKVMDPGGGSKWKVYASATVYGGGNSFRHYPGLQDCSGEPAL